jgi:hypothetical protein
MSARVKVAPVGTPSATVGAPEASLARAPKHFCIDCRTALGEHSACDGGRAHRVVNLEADEGRAALLSEVWGPPDLRRRARELAKAGGAGAALDSCANIGGCDGCVDLGGGGVGEIAGLLLGLLLAAVVLIALWWIVSKIVEAVRRHRAKLVAKGALVPAPRPPRGMLMGVVRAHANGSTRVGTPVATAVELQQARLGTNAVMLRAGRTAGMLIALDDGATLKIPPGRVRLEGSWHVHDDPFLALDVLDRSVGQVTEDEHGFALAPYDVTMRLDLHVGDRVAVHGPVALDAPTEAPGGYRGASRSLMAVGIPSLSRVD